MIKDLREQLLELHKALLDYQKAEYEAKNGLISNPNLYYQLVVSHESFAWLKTISALIVSIDELLEKPSELTDQKNKEIASYTKNLLADKDGTSTFSVNYQTALETSPKVSPLHTQLLSTLN